MELLQRLERLQHMDRWNSWNDWNLQNILNGRSLIPPASRLPARASRPLDGPTESASYLQSRVTENRIREFFQWLAAR